MWNDTEIENRKADFEVANLSQEKISLVNLIFKKASKGRILKLKLPLHWVSEQFGYSAIRFIRIFNPRESHVLMRVPMDQAIIGDVQHLSACDAGLYEEDSRGQDRQICSARRWKVIAKNLPQMLCGANPEFTSAQKNNVKYSDLNFWEKLATKSRRFTNWIISKNKGLRIPITDIWIVRKRQCFCLKAPRNWVGDYLGKMGCSSISMIPNEKDIFSLPQDALIVVGGTKIDHVYRTGLYKYANREEKKLCEMKSSGQFKQDFEKCVQSIFSLVSLGHAQSSQSRGDLSAVSKRFKE